MTKKELIDLLAEAEDISRRGAKRVVDTVFRSISNALEGGDRVEVRGLGSFKIKQYDGYEGRNPKTGEAVTIKPKKLPVFKAGKELKERVDY
ncbi:MAG: HU family DNA-binding protein [Desulfobacterales bacterium]